MLAGVDEVGRGPLAGPVVAAAVILDPDYHIAGLMDSKKITAKKREELAEIIWHKALAVSVAEASVEEIDDINILQASLLAMKRAVETLSIAPDEILVDGTHVFVCADGVSIKSVIKGDQKIEAISAASIIAKVYRDNLMQDLALSHPGYGFESHMGYPTKAHVQAIEKHGVLGIHRKSFAPVKRALVDYSYE